MALSLHSSMDMESSTEIAVREPQTWTSDDLFQAALAASKHDSDEDPYGPQPKRFMQTEHQKSQHARELDIRRMAWTLRKMKKAHKANRQQLKQKKRRPSPFEKLPSDLILKLMQHTHLRNIPELGNSSAINQSIYKTNQNAIFRGIEIEQFPEWKWLFGDSKHRSSAQSQHLKDAILSENWSPNPGAHGWAYDEQLSEIMQTIDKDKFTGVRNVMFLQDMQDRVDVDITATESYTGTKIARRTAMCLRSLSFQRPDIVKEENRTESGPLVNALTLPWEARSRLVNEQPASIQAEIRSVLKVVVDDQYHTFEAVVMQWAWRHYQNPGNHRKPQEVKKWMSKLATGLILETVIPHWRAGCMAPSPTPCFAWESASPNLARELGDLLDEHDGGDVDVLQDVERGVEFGRSIGLDLEGLFDGTLVGGYVETLGRDGDEEKA